MTYPQLCAGAGILVLAMIATFFAAMWALGLASMPDPYQIAVEYSRPAQVWHEVERREP